MDVWSLTQKYKEQAKIVNQLEARIKHLEDYLGKLTKDNKGKKDENIQDKEVKSSRVRTKRSTTKKS